MKTYTGIELLQAIKDGELIKGQELKDEHGNIYTVTDTVDLLRDNGWNAITDEMNLDVFIHTEFTLIEENQDIDIQSIEELDEEEAYTNIDLTTRWTRAEDILVKKLNESIQAIKQLDRQINNN